MQVDPGHYQAASDMPDEFSRARGLWAAVMQGAVSDVLGKNSTTKGRNRSVVNTELARSARMWFASDERGVGTFLWICGLLELDPAKVRARLGSPPH